MDSTLVIKLFGLLEATAGQDGGRSLAELAAEVGLTKPTAHRILKTLTGLGYMERPRPGIYRQSPRLRRLILGADNQDLVHRADPVLRELHRATEETVNLGVLRQARVVYLTVLESPQRLRRIVNPTMTDPFACTALGRAIVAHLPQGQRAFLLRTSVLERRTPHTVVDPTELATLLDAARRDGFAVEENETDLGVMCIGVPVFDRDGVAGAISLSLPTARSGPERRPRLIEAVRRAAEQVTKSMIEGRNEV
jgi:DNA-binding IclR family transcriptional regulator